VRAIARWATAAIAIVAAAVHAATPFEPIAREARLALVAVPSVSGQSVFLAAGLVLPRATTTDLAAFVRAAGAPAAAQWLCRTYTEASPASLRQVIQAVELATATDEHGAAAIDALVCPRLRRHVHEAIVEGCLLAPSCTSYRRIVSHDLSYPACVATPEQRAAFDEATCAQILLGRSGRAVALRVFASRAARADACLELSVSAGDPFELAIGNDGTPSVRLDVRADGCE
jgi:hypothetical protein